MVVELTRQGGGGEKKLNFKRRRELQHTRTHTHTHTHFTTTFAPKNSVSKKKEESV